ncbi:MAG TPA: O-methyltransferase [bacterium]|nr:O-methyltransferase [bacterium]
MELHQSPPEATHDLWTAVDRYLEGMLAPSDQALDAALQDSAAAGLPAIGVSPMQGRLLHLLARAIGARRILEIGTLGGYSAIWLGRALPDGGRMVTLEIDAKHAAIATANLARAGLGDRVEVRLGPALEGLARLAVQGEGPFDLIFVDADKESIPGYLDASLRLARPGALIIVDNVVRGGALADPNNDDPRVRGVRRLHEILRERGLTASTMQTVGVKGYDGLTIILAP